MGANYLKNSERMRQPVKGKGTGKSKKVKKTVKKPRSGRKTARKHKEFGTSKLEQDFARDFLDKLGLKYVYQYEAKDIKRYFDFMVTAEEDYPYKYVVREGVNSIDQDAQLFVPNFAIEVDGDYWHSNPDYVDESKLTPIQKHNRYVDKVKDTWCGMHCIPLLRIWEHDIRKNPGKVVDMLCEYSTAARKRKKMLDVRRRPH